MIAVVDYDTGNLRSVANALQRIGAEFTLTAEPALLLQAERVILPGVGEAASAMTRLRERGLDIVIPRLKAPVLGICIGMQLLCSWSEEGDTPCLGVFSARVRRLAAITEEGARLKVPHVGWDTIERLRSPLFNGIDEGAYLYYVHSFAAGIDPQQTVATTEYGSAFSAALARDNFFGVQFHPEKSGRTGARILENFLNGNL